jgi:hypothetical protein
VVIAGMCAEVAILREFLNSGGHRFGERTFRDCWVLAEIDGMRPAAFIDEVIVPASLRARTRALFDGSCATRPQLPTGGLGADQAIGHCPLYFGNGSMPLWRLSPQSRR